jgi:hypothetical protein
MRVLTNNSESALGSTLASIVMLWVFFRFFARRVDWTKVSARVFRRSRGA